MSSYSVFPAIALFPKMTVKACLLAWAWLCRPDLSCMTPGSATPFMTGTPACESRQLDPQLTQAELGHARLVASAVCGSRSHTQPILSAPVPLRGVYGA